MEDACNYNLKKSVSLKKLRNLKKKVKKAKEAKIRKRRRKKNIKKKIRQLLVLSVLSSILFLLFFSAKEIYLTYKCRDFDYATKYYLTSGNKDESLLRIQSSSLVFSDTEKMVIRAKGLSRSSPHEKTILEGHFKKGFLGKWNQENIYILEDSN